MAEPRGKPQPPLPLGHNLSAPNRLVILLLDQAKVLQNPVEMGLSTLEDVVDRVMDSPAKMLFLKLYGKEIYDGGTLNVPVAYNKIAEAIMAFEASDELNTFSSRFDGFSREQG